MKLIRFFANDFWTCPENSVLELVLTRLGDSDCRVRKSAVDCLAVIAGKFEIELQPFYGPLLSIAGFDCQPTACCALELIKSTATGRDLNELREIICQMMNMIFGFPDDQRIIYGIDCLTIARNDKGLALLVLNFVWDFSGNELPFSVRQAVCVNMTLLLKGIVVPFAADLYHRMVHWYQKAEIPNSLAVIGSLSYGSPDVVQSFLHEIHDLLIDALQRFSEGCFLKSAVTTICSMSINNLDMTEVMPSLLEHVITSLSRGETASTKGTILTSLEFLLKMKTSTVLKYAGASFYGCLGYMVQAMNDMYEVYGEETSIVVAPMCRIVRILLRKVDWTGRVSVCRLGCRLLKASCEVPALVNRMARDFVNLLSDMMQFSELREELADRIKVIGGIGHLIEMGMRMNGHGDHDIGAVLAALGLEFPQ
jgi:hypothetical protein